MPDPNPSFAVLRFCIIFIRIWIQDVNKFVMDPDPGRTLLRIWIQAKMIRIRIRIQEKKESVLLVKGNSWWSTCWNIEMSPPYTVQYLRGAVRSWVKYSSEADNSLAIPKIKRNRSPSLLTALEWKNGFTNSLYSRCLYTLKVGQSKLKWLKGGHTRIFKFISLLEI